MLRKYLDKIKPNFEEGGKLHAFRSVFDGMETFLYTPRTTSASGVHIHDSIDSKRVMIIVVIALMPCLLFGMYNTGYQNFVGSGITDLNFWKIMLYGFLAILPKIIVTYVTGLGIEFIVAQWRNEEIQEGFLVTGILVPLICPVTTPRFPFLRLSRANERRQGIHFKRAYLRSWRYSAVQRRFHRCYSAGADCQRLCGSY